MSDQEYSFQRMKNCLGLIFDLLSTENAFPYSGISRRNFIHALVYPEELKEAITNFETQIGQYGTSNNLGDRIDILKKKLNIFYAKYPFAIDLNPLSGPNTTPLLDVSNLNDYYIGDDGYGDILETYPSVGSTTAALALANDSFFSILLTFSPGTFGGPIMVTFDAGKGGNSSPRGYFITTSLDNYASNVFSMTLPDGQPAPTSESFLVNAYGKTSVTFRFYVWTPDPLDNSVDFRNIVFTC